MAISQRKHLEKQAQWRPDKTVIYDAQNGTEISYSQLNSRANRVANVLSEFGVRLNDRVAIMTHNTVQFPEILYGCFKIGAVPVALNYRLSAEDIVHVLDKVNEQIFIYDAEFSDIASFVSTNLHSDAPHMTIESSNFNEGPDPDVCLSDELTRVSDSAPPPFQRYPNDISYMFCTSGTTGRPKVVAHSAKSGSERVRVSLNESELTPDSTWLGLLPWFHGSGIDTVVRGAVTAGASLVALKDYSDADAALECIRNYPVTHVMTVPTLTERFVRDKSADSSDFSNITCWRHTGEVLTENQAHTFMEEITPNIYNSYGSSEGGLNTMLRPEDLPEHAGSVGRPVAGDEIRLIELDNDRFVEPSETVEPGTDGEVIIRTDQLFFGYFEDYEKTKARVYNGWYYTHDVGIVKEGHLYIKGRTDDMLLSGGELISAIEVEEALKTHEDVVDAVVIGVPHQDWGERVEAFVEFASESETDSSTLDVYLQETEHLANYKRPREYHITDKISTTGSGKKQRSVYKEQLITEESS